MIERQEGAVHHLDVPTQMMLQFVALEDGRLHLRKWSTGRPFDGAALYLYAGNGAPLGPHDDAVNFSHEQLPSALRSIAGNLFCECDRHVLGEMVQIILAAAQAIEAHTPTPNQTGDTHDARR